MRQAGRFMPEYRQIRQNVSFLELCKNSQLAAEVTVMAVDKLEVDAAILFADILLLLEPLGVGLEYAKGDGPLIHRPVRTSDDVSALASYSVEDALGYVFSTVEIARAELSPDVPLIGFAGAPFTLASYLIEGGSSRHFEHTKKLIFSQPEAWNRLLSLLTDLTIRYLNGQIKAGAQAVQVFDSWIGCLNRSDYQKMVLPHMQRLFAGLNPEVPAIHFGTGTAHLLDYMKQAGGQVIGLDWRVDLDDAWAALGHDTGIQGNLDPVWLLAERKELETAASGILNRASNRPGHIFNLGHGVLPQTPFDNVRALVDFVHERSSR
jgi:uroporphyrinogen decarboxylase